MTRRFMTVAVAALALAAGPAAVPAQERGRPDRGGRAEPEGYALRLSGAVDAELAPVVGRLATVFYESYPKLVARFAHPDHPPAREVRVVIVPEMNVPAACSGDTIRVSGAWLRQHPEDVGLLTHELTHVVQAYPRGGPGWLTEGIADLARKLYGPADQPGWSLPETLGPRHSYRDGYRVSARFLLWLDEAHPGSVDAIHRKLQDGTFQLGDLESIAGKPLDALWDDCVRALSGDGAGAAAR